MSFPLLLSSETIQTKDLSICVPGTVHTFCALIDSLKAQCDEFAAIVAGGGGGAVASVEANPVDGQGLMSSIHRISIHFTNGRRFVAILKVASTLKLERLNPIEDAARKRGRTDEEVEAKVEIGWDIEKIRKFLFEMFELEENFFKLIVPTFPLHLLQIVPNPFAVFPIPDCQQVENGFVLMEDVSTKGAQQNFYEGLTAGQVASTVVHLAQLHTFTATLPNALLCKFRVNEYGRLDEMGDQLVERVLSLGTPYFERHQKTLRAFISVHNKLKTDVHKCFGIRPVLSHGDLWSNNLFFNRSENDELGDELSSIVDWQTCHEGTGLNDVIRLIFSSVNAPLRRDRMNEWLDLYFDTIEQESRKLNIEPPMEYPKGLRRDLFEEQRHFELTFVFLCFPTLFPQAKSAVHRRNLIERMETLFEESREQYEQINAAQEGTTTKPNQWENSKTGTKK